MNSLNPYLNFNGNTEEAFNHYKAIFGGEFITVMRFRDTPGCENMPEVEQDHIMHIALPLKGNILMGTDIPKSMDQAIFGTNISLSVNMESRGEADRVYNALAEGGKAVMPMQDMFWGDYYGMLVDKFGVQWMITHGPEKQ